VTNKEYILDTWGKTFDFEEVLKVMTFLDWEWSQIRNPSRVPTIKEMKELVAKLLEYVMEEVRKGDLQTHSGIQSGGFQVSYHKGKYYLAFILDEDRGVNPQHRLQSDESESE
jgi:hypothetical protein